MAKAKKKTYRTKTLEVRFTFWPYHRYTFSHKGESHTVDNLEAARAFAATHGYAAGIRVRGDEKSGR